MLSSDGAPISDITYAAFDGLQLHVRHYEAREAKGRPVVCLPGLTRNGRDFDALASFLSRHPERPRDVYCVDYRGRGLSQHDPDWRNYAPAVELMDVLDFMALAGLHQAGIVGTSRGGIIAMMMAAARPSAIGVCVLNDIGPVIETRGLARIMGYTGKTPLPLSWEDAALLVRGMHERAFPAIQGDEWKAVARAIFNEENGRPAYGYDVDLGRAVGEIDLGQTLPELWPQFAALSQFPVLVLRGINSDILSAETLQLMGERHPNLRTVTVAGQGHAPFLRDDETLGIVATFLAAND